MKYLLGNSVITGSTVKGLSQYWENIVIRVSSTMEALVRSVGVEGDLGVLPVNNWRQGENHIVGVVDDGVHGAVLDDREVGLEVSQWGKAPSAEVPRCTPWSGSGALPDSA